MKGNPKNLPKKVKSNSTSTPEMAVTDAFLATDEMGEFLSAQSAARNASERGEAEVTLPAALMHTILRAAQPMDFDHLRQAHNRICDELGKPEEKVPDPPPVEYEEGKGPF